MSLLGCCFPSITPVQISLEFYRTLVMHMFAPEVTVRGIKLIVMTGDVSQIYGSAGGDTSKNSEQVRAGSAGSGPNS